MTDQRPTPEQLADWLDAGISEIEGCGGLYVAEQLLDRLETEGYVIVHPDDVPAGLAEYGRWPGQVESARRIGWDDCRRLIFGEDA